MRSIVLRFAIGIVLILITTTLIPAAASANWLGRIGFSHPSPSYLPNGEYVDVTIDCLVTQAGGVQILVHPFTDGALTPGYQYSGSSLIPVGQSTVTRSFSVGNSHEETVDHVRIQLLTADFSIMIQEFFVRVGYEFGHYGLFNVRLDQVNHSVLTKGSNLNVEVDYGSPGPSNVLIFARPYFEGAPASGYSASAGYLGPPSGTATQSFTFSMVDADIDQIRIYMKDVNQTVTHLEVFHPVDYSWRDVGITNLCVGVPSPSQVYIDDLVTTSFDYDNQTGGDIKIWVRPFHDGSFALHNVYEGSSPISPGSGFTTRWMGATGPSYINQAQLLVTNSDYSTTYIEKYIPVEYDYSEHMVYSITMNPAPPALLDFNEFANATFYYKSKDPGPIYIYAEPYFLGSLIQDYGSTGSPAYSTPSGTGGIVFRIESYSYIQEADQIRFSIWDNTFTLLDDYFVDASLLWGDTGWVSPVPGALPAATVRLDQNYPNPFNPTTSIPVELTGTRHVRLAVYDLRGRLVRILVDEVMGTGRHEIPFDGSDLASGAYYYRLEGGGPVQTRSMMLVK